MKFTPLLILWTVLFLGKSFYSWGDVGCSTCLDLLELQVWNELEKVNTPSSLSWILRTHGDDVLDVAIIGGGMAGMTSALALIKEGIKHIKVFDENYQGEEGPWSKCARMNMLRSEKTNMGPALGIPSLTFRAWYEAQHGKENWDRLKSIPTSLWCKYLRWFRHVLKLPVENHLTLVKLSPLGHCFELTFNKDGETIHYYARKVVLATGREGIGGLEIPPFMANISKTLYAHTGERIDPHFFCQKRIAIIGAGASAFDAAGVALENGAQSVDMLVRRRVLPAAYSSTQFFYPGIVHGFYFLPDDSRCHFFVESLKRANPPPKEALERIKNYHHFHVHDGTDISGICDQGESAVIQTNHGNLEVDFIVCGTGYKVDISKRAELNEISPSILLWEDRVPPDLLQQFSKLGRFPYLGPHFEFLEKEPGATPFLKDVYCFNYGAALSHGMLTGDIPSISIWATRLAQGIVSDFFLSENQLYFEKLSEASMH